jgi:hypothetical protein
MAFVVKALVWVSLIPHEALRSQDPSMYCRF